MLRLVTQNELIKTEMRRNIKIALRTFLIDFDEIICGILIEADGKTYFTPYSIQKEKGRHVNYYDYQIKEADELLLDLSLALPRQHTESYGFEVLGGDNRIKIFEQPVLVIDSEGRELDEKVAVPSGVIRFDLCDTLRDRSYIDGTWDDELWYAIGSSSVFENAEFNEHKQDVLHNLVHLDGRLKPWFIEDVFRVEVKYEFTSIAENEALFAPVLAE